jgi:hypothetical protein
MDNIVADFSADSLMICIHSLERRGVYYLSFDKADKLKGKLGGCVKLLSWFDETRTTNKFPDGLVLTMQLDADKTGDSSTDVALGVAYSFAKLDLSRNVQGSFSQGTCSR